jgi:hypothetical protein
MYRLVRAIASDDSAVKFLFDHVRNLGIVAIVLGAAMWKFRHATQGPLYLELLIAVVLGVFGVFLFFVNQFHGILRLKSAGYPGWVTSLVISAYSVVTVTVIMSIVLRQT